MPIYKISLSKGHEKLSVRRKKNYSHYNNDTFNKRTKREDTFAIKANSDKKKNYPYSGEKRIILIILNRSTIKLCRTKKRNIYLREIGIYPMLLLAEKLLIEARWSRASSCLFSARAVRFYHVIFIAPLDRVTSIYLTFLIYLSTLKQINRILRGRVGLLRDIKSAAQPRRSFLLGINCAGVREIARG